MIIRKKRLTKLLKNGYESGLKEEKNAPGFHSVSSSFSSFKTNTFSDNNNDHKGLISLGVGTGVGIGTKFLMDKLDPPEELSEGEKALAEALKKREKREITWNPFTTAKDMWDEGKKKAEDLKNLDKEVEAAKKKIKEEAVSLKSRSANKWIAGIAGGVSAIGTLALLNTKKHDRSAHIKGRMRENDDHISRALGESSRRFESGNYNPNFHDVHYEKKEDNKRRSLFQKDSDEKKSDSSEEYNDDYVLPVDKEKVRETVEHALRNPEETAEKIRKVKNLAADAGLAKTSYEFIRHNLFDVN